MQLPMEKRKKILDGFTDTEKANLNYTWRIHARPNQLAPEEEWAVWLLLGGRGSGKTRSGAEWVRERVEIGQAKNIALLGATIPDTRTIMIEGDSGILNVFHPSNKPIYQPSRRRIIFSNGAIATTYTAEKPDQIRGQNVDLLWGDEFVKWPYPQDALDNALFSCRKGEDPRATITTTPKPFPELKDLIADPQTIVTHSTMLENMSNLSERFIQRITRKYGGTRLWRQEALGELIEEVEGALWHWDYFRRVAYKHKPRAYDRIVIGVDPSVSATGDETGIVVVGKLAGSYFTLADYSLRGEPREWAEAVLNAYDKWQADQVIGEGNNGGELVASNIRQYAEIQKLNGNRKSSEIPIKIVHASRGKAPRAQPVATIYSEQRFWHLGIFTELEEQLTSWVPDVSKKSPDRLDALVWAATALMETDEVDMFFTDGSD